MPCTLIVSPAGGPCPTEEHTQSTARLKSQLLVSWAKGEVSTLQCLQPKRAMLLRTKSKFSLHVYLAVSLGMEGWQQVLSYRFALNRFVGNRVSITLGSFKLLHLSPSRFLWHMAGGSWVHCALNTTVFKYSCEKKDKSTKFSNLRSWLLSKGSGLSASMQTRLVKSDGSHTLQHTACPG